MRTKSIDNAQNELEREVEEEAVMQVELGYPKYQAIARAQKIVRKRRQRKSECLLPRRESDR